MLKGVFTHVTLQHILLFKIKVCGWIITAFLINRFNKQLLFSLVLINLFAHFGNNPGRRWDFVHRHVKRLDPEAQTCGDKGQVVEMQTNKDTHTQTHKQRVSVSSVSAAMAWCQLPRLELSVCMRRENGSESQGIMPRLLGLQVWLTCDKVKNTKEWAFTKGKTPAGQLWISCPALTVPAVPALLNTHTQLGEHESQQSS